MTFAVSTQSCELSVDPSPAAPRAAARENARTARVEIFHTLAEAAPHWHALERDGALMTPYQRYEFLEAWQRHIGAAEGVTPMIAVSFDRHGAPLTLWPLGSRALGALRVGEFLGGKHANYNFALWRRDAAHIAAADLEAIRARLAQEVDVLALTNQPKRWDGIVNPLTRWPHQPSPSFGYCGALSADFDALMRERTNSEARRKMRKKERALAALGEVKFLRARDERDISRVLNAFFEQKNARMHAAGITDPFADIGVRRFIEAVGSARRSDGTSVIELYALTVGDTVAATFSGMIADGRFSGMFLSMAAGPLAVASPGEQLLIHLVRECCERQLTTFDLGVGDARYKNWLCPDMERLFDSHIGLSARGRLVAAGLREVAGIKRMIKQNPVLWQLIEKARRLRARYFRSSPR